MSDAMRGEVTRGIALGLTERYNVVAGVAKRSVTATVREFSTMGRVLAVSPEVRATVSLTRIFH